MAVSMERLGRTWFECNFWLGIGIGEPFLVSLVKYLYRRALPCRTNTIDSSTRDVTMRVVLARRRPLLVYAKLTERSEETMGAGKWRGG